MPEIDHLGRETRAPELVRICIAFTILSGITVFLRFYTRLIILRRVGIEDFFILLAWSCSACLAGFVIERTHHGLGRHIQTVSNNDLAMLKTPLLFSVIMYNLSLTFIKISILFQYLRIVYERYMRVICWSFMAFTLVYGIWLILATTVICRPLTFYWRKDSSRGHCSNKQALWFTNNGVNVVLDFIILALPLVFIWTAQLPLRQKIGLGLVFAMGLFTCIVSVLRVEALSHSFSSDDVSWNSAQAVSWSDIEVNIAITTSCLPGLKPLVSRMFPTLFSSPRDRKSRLWPSMISVNGKSQVFAGDMNIGNDNGRMTASHASSEPQKTEDSFTITSQKDLGVDGDAYLLQADLEAQRKGEFVFNPIRPGGRHRDTFDPAARAALEAKAGLRSGNEYPLRALNMSTTSLTGEEVRSETPNSMIASSTCLVPAAYMRPESRSLSRISSFPEELGRSTLSRVGSFPEGRQGFARVGSFPEERSSTSRVGFAEERSSSGSTVECAEERSTIRVAFVPEPIRYGSRAGFI